MYSTELYCTVFQLARILYLHAWKRHGNYEIAKPVDEASQRHGRRAWSLLEQFCCDELRNGTESDGKPDDHSNDAHTADVRQEVYAVLEYE